MSVAPEILRAAQETYGLELAVNDGLSTDALGKAIESGLLAHERGVLHRVAAEAESFAMGMEASDDGENPDFAVALRWFAYKIREGAGVQPGPYMPVDDDVVEVTVTGLVSRGDETCPHVGCMHHRSEWSVTDDLTGEEYFFATDRAPRVRVLSKSDIEETQQ